jgi:ADP-ribose pyrophosphatase
MKFVGQKYTFISKRVKVPNGVITQLDYIDHPGAVLIVPFVKANQVILLKQYRPAIEQTIYEFPAGTIDPGERPLVCAKRELIEETGCRGKRFKKIGKILPVPGYSNEIITCYRADDLVEAQADGDADEVIEVCVFSRKEVGQLFKSGKILDSKTICGLAFVGWLS